MRIIAAVCAWALASAASAQAPMTGTIDRAEWGAELTLPPGWRAVEKNGILAAGSDREAGLIIIRFAPGASRQELLDGYAAGLREDGFVAMPVEKAVALDAPGGQALAGVLEGQAADGTKVRVRSVGVLSPHGGALVVMGLTTLPLYRSLAARVDAVARSVAFRRPPEGTAIAGRYEFVYVSPSGGYTREASITLCRSGRFTRRGELSGSGSSGSAATSRREGGTWRAGGSAAAGTLTLTWGDGTTTTLQYRASQNPKDRSAYGAALHIGDTLYQKTGDGGC
jgi:hypothetical protein